MNYFEVVSKYKDAGLTLPVRATKTSCGYDLAAAEDYIIPSFDAANLTSWRFYNIFHDIQSYSFDELEKYAKDYRVPVISTGMKIHLDDDCYLHIAPRSSSPLKHFITIANTPGVIDADYYNNASNEGEIFLQIMNFSPVPIAIHKGDKIAQGIILKYETVANEEEVTAVRAGGYGSTGNG